MVTLSPNSAVATPDWVGDEAEEEDGLFGVLSIAEDNVVAYLVKSTTILVDGIEEEFAQICSLDFFCPVMLVVPMAEFDPICDQYGLSYQHLDELYEEHFGLEDLGGTDAVLQRLHLAQMLHQQVQATDHSADTEEDRVEFATESLLALHYILIEDTVEYRFKHMDLWVGTFTHLGVFEPSDAIDVEEFFSAPVE